MAKKVRELKQMLRQQGFTELTGKGSHTNWIHPLYNGKLTISGKDGDDARRYLEKSVQDALQEVRRNSQHE